MMALIIFLDVAIVSSLAVDFEFI